MTGAQGRRFDKGKEQAESIEEQMWRLKRNHIKEGLHQQENSVCVHRANSMCELIFELA